MTVLVFTAADLLALLAILDTHPNVNPALVAKVEGAWQTARAAEAPPTPEEPT